MLDKQSAVPLYDQLVDLLLVEIHDGLKVNDKMMSEREICRLHEVSRTTVRLAFAELENMGYIYKRHGKGTFVAAVNKSKQNLLDNYSFTDQMRGIGRKPTTQVLSFAVVITNQYIGEHMMLGVGARVYRLKRLRLADGMPMMVETSYLPLDLFEGLDRERIESRPLYDIFAEDFNQKVFWAEEEFQASILTESEGDPLGVLEGSPCLRLKRIAQNADEQVIEFSLSVARSDQFTYKVRYQK